jgi:hypothetical protein
MASFITSFLRASMLTGTAAPAIPPIRRGLLNWDRMPCREPSPAEKSLVGEVNARLGTVFTTKQFARWREERYLRPLLREWRGRNGSASAWDKKLLEEAVALGAAKAGRTPLYEAALSVFVAGGQIGEASVRRAYSAALDVTERFLRAGCGADDPAEVAQTVAPTMVKRLLRTPDGTRWKKRLVAAHKEPQESLERMCEAMVAIALGGPLPSRAAVQDFLDASGLAAAEHESVGGLGPWAAGLSRERISDGLQEFSVPALRRRIASTPFADLCRARDSAKQLVSLITAVAPVIKETTQTPDALGFAEFTYLDLDRQLPLLVPAVLIFEEMGLDVQRVVRLARRFVPLYRALNVLLRAMPRHLRRFMTPDGITRLNNRPRHDRIAFIRHLQKSIADHPDAAAAVVRTGNRRLSVFGGQKEPFRE